MWQFGLFVLCFALWIGDLFEASISNITLIETGNKNTLDKVPSLNRVPLA